MTDNHGIHIVDTEFQQPHFDAAYLIVENGRGAFVDCGTNHSVPLLLAAAARAGLAPEQIDWLLLTHVHLDHAGGAGLLMQHLPNAKLVVHPRGAPHMIDPSRLIAGATAVYGEAEIRRSYGEIQPVPEARVVVADVDAAHEFSVDLNGRALRCMDAPGHARHHIALWDERSRCWFSGDTFGLSYREFDTANGAFILPTTTPVQFEPDALKQSIARMLEREPRAMYLTHYGRVEGVRKLAGDLYAQIDDMVRIAHAADGAADRHERLKEALAALYLRRAREHGVAQDDAQVRALLRFDIELNAQGLEVWLDKARRAA